MAKIVLFGMFLIIIGLFVFLKIRYSDDNVSNIISKANYCQTSEDCEVVSGQCPLGCQFVVNKHEVNNVKRVLKMYRLTSLLNTCLYQCNPVTTVQCLDNKCTPQYLLSNK